MPTTPDSVAEFTARLAAKLTEPGRIQAVQATGLLDSDPEPAFDRIAALASHLLKAPFGFITVVDDHRSFWKASHGLPADRPSGNTVEESFCQYVIGTDQSFCVSDARLHALTEHNPSIQTMNVRAWAGAPIRTGDGNVLGTICVVDTTPREWTPDDEAILDLLAEIVLDEISSRKLGAAAAWSESVLNAVLERAPIGFGLVDESMRYEMINDALAQINGLPASDHIGRSVHTVLPDIAESIVPILQGVIEFGEPAIGIEITGTTAAGIGTIRHWLANYYRLDVGDGLRRVGMFVEDVTDGVNQRKQAEALAEVTAGLATADSISAIGRVIAEHATAYFDTDIAILGLVDRPRGEMVLIGNQNVIDASTNDNGAGIGIDDDAPYAEAYRTGRMVVVESAADRNERYPQRAINSLGIEASACVPCKASTGNVLGVLVVAWFQPIAARDMPRAQLRTIGAIVSQAVERLQIAEEHNQLVATLQRDLHRASTADHERLDLTVHYEPMSDAIGFGGDWYDVVEIDKHRTALVVGDVTGHNAKAAAHMTRIRTILATLLGLDTDLGILFAEVERLLGADSTTVMASAAVVVVDHDQNTATTVCAGHPPPILVPLDGPSRRVQHGLGPWIGVGNGRLETPSVHLDPGAALVLYTDGLVEQRDSDIVSDIDRLVDYVDHLEFVADDCETKTSQIVRRLTVEFLGDSPRVDDVALVAACVRSVED